MSSDTWWLNSSATIQACNSMQAVISRRSPTSLEHYVYMGDSTRVQVDYFRVVRLQLSTGNFFELQDIAFMPSIKRNLISVPIWIDLDITFFFFFLFFGTGKVELH